MAIHSSILAWRISWREEPGGLQSMGSQRVRHDWAILLHFKDYKKKYIFMEISTYYSYFNFSNEKLTYINT